jgi:hypothetical protein
METMKENSWKIAHGWKYNIKKILKKYGGCILTGFSWLRV